MAYVILTLGLGAILAAWDFGRRQLDVRRFNQKALDRIEEQARELERVNTQMQAVLGKLTNMTAATSTRVPRIGGRP